MPKIDTTKIENYANMTAEEKLAALESYEYAADNADAERLKAAVSRANSEAAELKRQLKAKQTEEERKEAERLEAEAAVKAELETLRMENAVAKNKTEFLSLGYDDALATDTATALAKGDMAKVFANQKTHLENVRKAARATALAGEPKPPAGGGGGIADKKAFDTMSSADQIKFISENPNWKEIITTKKE